LKEIIMANKKQMEFGAYAVTPLTYVSASATLPVADGEYVINGAAAVTVTLPLPNLQNAAGVYVQDGTKMVFRAATAHAHLVEGPALSINGADDKVTFAAIGDKAEFVAVNGVWVVSTSLALAEV
jgi:hypothetical protein